MFNLNQDVKLEQQLNMNLDLKMAIDILSMSHEELLNSINKEANENVFVDFVNKDDYSKKPCRKNYYNNYDDFTKILEETVPDEKSLKDYLILQLLEEKLNKEEFLCGDYIIHSLDSSGFFKEDIKSSSKILKVDEKCFKKVLKIIQGFSPIGVGSKDMVDCLLKQAESDKLKIIIRNHLKDLADRNYGIICEKLKISVNELEFLINNLKKLSPRPCNLQNKGRVSYIHPDFIIEKTHSGFKVEMLEDYQININKEYFDIYNKSFGKDKSYMQKMLYRANFIKKAIMIRKENLHKVIWGILYLQKDFFEKGLGLNPLTMNDLAKYCGISQSSVSRLTSNKYLVFKDKIYKLKDFFPSLVPGQKKNVTPKKLKNILLWIIEKEDKTKPFSDKELVSKLEDEGINIKRRTVAKYRNELGIKGKFKRAVVNR